MGDNADTGHEPTEAEDAAPADPTSVAVSRRRLLVYGSATVGGVALGAGPAAAIVRERRAQRSLEALRAIDVKAYPSLGKREHGLMRWMHTKANLPKGDWSLWEPTAAEGRSGMEYSESDSGPSYDAFWSSQAVAVTAIKTPAYRELYQDVLGGLVDKQLDSHVWAYWTRNEGGTNNDGTHMPYAADPAQTANAMYLGNFLGSLGYYALITNDQKYDRRPMEFVYEGPDVEVAGVKTRTGKTWRHTWTEVVRTVKKQTDADAQRMIPCQLPSLYFICNVSVQLGFLAHDRMYGRNVMSKDSYAPGGFWERVGEDWFVPARSTGLPLQSIHLWRRVESQDPRVEVPTPLPFAKDQAYPAYVNALMATKKDFALDIYDFAKTRMYTPQPDGTAFWRSAGGSALAWEVAGVPATQTAETNFFLNDLYATLRAAGAARYVGDDEAAEATLAWIEKWCGPRWDGDSLSYTFNYTDEDVIQRSGHGNAMVLHGLSAMHGGTIPVFAKDRSRFQQPTLAGVDYPTVTVSTASYHEANEVLVLKLAARSASMIRIENLQPGRDVNILIDRTEFLTRRADARGVVGLRIPRGESSIVVAQ